MTCFAAVVHGPAFVAVEMAMSWTLDHLAEYTVVDIARPETFDLECVNPYFFSALEWQEAFAAEQPIQSAREWLVRKAAGAEDDAEIVAYESVYYIVKGNRFLNPEKRALLHVWNVYDQCEQVLVFQPHPQVAKWLGSGGRQNLA